ncbi:MAG: acyl-CoA dehydrogenase family protein [Gracilibacteraceae bacterium]|nr:acyl-CoA dehydrogenase family protein [Gracilibacteraceae bacterium]
MDFQFTEEQALLSQSIREFAAESLAQEDKYQVVKDLADMDALGIMAGEEYGGLACDCTSFLICVEELAKVSPVTAFIYAGHVCLALNVVEKYGAEQARRAFLPALLSGAKIGAFACAEGKPGVDYGLITTTARLEGESYILNGAKSYVPCYGGDSALIVLARTAENELSAFVVDGDADGLSWGGAQAMMGLSGLRVCDLALDNVAIPAAQLLGQPGQGRQIAAEAMALHDVAIAMIAAALQETALVKSMTYGAQRVQFGRPISRFEAIQVMLGKMKMNSEAARLLAYKAAALKDDGEDFSLAASVARGFAQSTGEQTVLDAMQIHGGYGFSLDLGIAPLLTDMKGISLFHGGGQSVILDIAQKTVA